MDCRKSVVLLFALCMTGSGCITEQKSALSDQTKTTVWTPASLFHKEGKRQPKAETCLEGGQMLEGQATSERLNGLEREQLLEQARKAYQQALEIEPGNAQALIGLAHVYVKLQQFEKAQATYEAGLKLHPKNAKIWSELAQCQFKQRNYGKAADAYRKAMELQPDERTYAKHLSLNLALAGRQKEALEVLGTLYGEAQAHYKLAILLRHIDQPEEARRHVELALQRDPLNRPAEQLLAEMQRPAPAPDGVMQASYTSATPAAPVVPALYTETPTIPAPSGGPARLTFLEQ